MYIEPNTDIRLLSGVKIDTTYENSLFFESLAAQTNFFISMTRHNLTDQYFQRVTKGVARVQVPIGQLYDCSYMMFRNTSFCGKWFYAFIDNVEYVNNSVSEIKYTLDVIQSWLFDYNTFECFIERNHSVTDNIGDNILPESIELGEFVYNSYERLVQPSGEVDIHSFEPSCVILAINDIVGGEAFAGKYDGVLSGSRLWAFRDGDVEGVKQKINEYIQKPDAISALYMCPMNLIGFRPADGGEDILAHYGSGGAPATSKSAVRFKETIPVSSRINENSTLDGYLPKNKKLLTYPYNYLEIITGSGDSITTRYEFFNGTPSFEINGTISMPVQASLRPANYKNAGELTLALSDEQLTLTNFPMGSWLNDAYEAWVAQNSIPRLLSGASGMAGIAAGAVGGMIMGTVAAPVLGIGVLAGGGSLIASHLTQSYKASIAADQSHGNPSSGNVNYANVTQDFFCGRRSITAQFAKIVDDYFTMFGYAQNQIGAVNKNIRPHWTYVKTLGCQGDGSVPNDDAKLIDKIYDTGIRFWRNNSEIGNYALDNSPV